jgi:hercynine metabolism protein
MSPAADWLEQLEARLEQQLEAFLRANPAQEALLNEQAQRDQQQRQRQQLLQAEALRSELLQIAADVHKWRDRSARASSAGATNLATRADQQVDQLMDRGRLRWQALEQLGREVRNNVVAAAAQPTAAAHTNSANPANEPLDQAWARFEVDQELEALRRRQQRGR